MNLLYTNELIRAFEEDYISNQKMNIDENFVKANFISSLLDSEASIQVNLINFENNAPQMLKQMQNDQYPTEKTEKADSYSVSFSSTCATGTKEETSLFDPSFDINKSEAKLTNAVKAKTNQNLNKHLNNLTKGTPLNTLKKADFENCFGCKIDFKDIGFEIPSLEWGLQFAELIKKIKEAIDKLEKELDPGKAYANICLLIDAIMKAGICPSTLPQIASILPSLYIKYSSDLFSIKVDWLTFFGPVIKFVVSSIVSLIENIPRITKPIIDCLVKTMQSIRKLWNWYATLVNDLSQVAFNFTESIYGIGKTLADGGKSFIENFDANKKRKEQEKLDIAYFEMISERILLSFIDEISIKNPQYAGSPFNSQIDATWNLLKVRQSDSFIIYDKKIFDDYRNKDLDSEKNKKKEVYSNLYYYTKEIVENYETNFRIKVTQKLLSKDPKEKENIIYVDLVLKDLPNSGVLSNNTESQQSVKASLEKIPKPNKDSKAPNNLAKALNKPGELAQSKITDKILDFYNDTMVPNSDTLLKKYGIDYRAKYEPNEFLYDFFVKRVSNVTNGVTAGLDNIILLLNETQTYIQSYVGNIINALKALNTAVNRKLDNVIQINGKILQLVHSIRLVLLVHKLITRGIKDCKSLKENTVKANDIAKEIDPNIKFSNSSDIEKNKEYTDKLKQNINNEKYKDIDINDYLAISSKDNITTTLINQKDCDMVTSKIRLDNDEIQDKLFEVLQNEYLARRI